MTAIKYQKPVKSIKIGKFTIKGKKFKKNLWCDLNKYSKLAGAKRRITVTPATGWEVIDIKYMGTGDMRRVENGKKVKIDLGVESCFLITLWKQVDGKYFIVDLVVYLM